MTRNPILVLGASGKTGRRIVERLRARELTEDGVPDDVGALLRYLFGEVLDGRNASVTDGVERALGRPPRDFADFAREAAASGAWNGQP